MEKKFFIADAHCDTISKIYENGEALYENSGHLDLKRARDIGLSLQLFAVWVRTGEDSPFKKASEMIKTYHEECAKNIDIVAKIRSKWDYEDGKIGAVLTVEGGHVLEGKIENLQALYDMGVRLMTLTWNGENELGFGAVSKKGEGLTPFGIEVVQKMEQLGMFIDISHLSEKGFWEVMENTKDETPIFATHSNSKSICNHPRNLTDEQIKAIIKRNGYIGLNLCVDYLGGNLLSFINKHTRHILELGGEKVLGFGFDFDGTDDLPRGIRGLEDVYKITRKLRKVYGEIIAEEICGKNLQRFFK